MATEMSSLRGLATRQIIREIQSGRFQPGTIVTEVQICEIVGLNRTPVREALIELVANGVIEKVPHKGYQVREFDEKSKIDVFEIIAVLDALAARLSIEKMTDEDFMESLISKEELLDYLQNDQLTGLNNADTFYRATHEMLIADPDTEYVMARFDVDSFSMIFDNSCCHCIKEILEMFCR